MDTFITSDLPDDVADLQAMVVSLRESLAELRKELDLLRAELAEIKGLQPAREAVLKERIDDLERRLFGKKKERRLAPPKDPTETKRTARPHGRGPIPPSLPRETTHDDPKEAEEPCPVCGKARIRIGEEVSEQVDWIPGKLVVRRQVRGTWACSCGQCAPVTAKAPQRPVEHGMFAATFIAMLIMDKYADHLPIHRTKQRLARLGGDFHLNTLLDQVKYGAERLEPIVSCMRGMRNSAPILHVDDTGLLVLGDEKGKEHKGYIWIYVAMDDGGAPVQVTYEYTPTRAGYQPSGPQELLDGYQGTIVADAFTGFDALFGPGKATEAGCWMHVRRGFFESLPTAKAEAEEGVTRINKLFEIERRAKAERMSPTQRKELRQRESKPIVDGIEAWVDALAPSVLPQSKLGKALTYAKNQRKALRTFLEDGRIEMDNGHAERGMRGVAMGRKNWIFAGNNAAARRTAVLYTLIGSCRLVGIDPYAYLVDVLERVSDHPASRIAELTPAAWAAARASALSTA